MIVARKDFKELEGNCWTGLFANTADEDSLFVNKNDG